jgi:hypothetical protein
VGAYERVIIAVYTVSDASGARVSGGVERYVVLGLLPDGTARSA